jgi:signal transduction histidine kinase
VRLYESALLANQAKSDFLAVMSHELRTPLTTVMGYTDLMLSGLPEPLPETARRYAQRVRLAAWHLLAIIEQILVYTRLEVGTEAPHPERVSGMDVLQDAAGLIEPVAREKGVDFILERPAEPIVIETDATKLRQILLNLLSNAIKFTPEGGRIQVTARGERDALVLAVSDSGEGIPAEHLPHIFEKYYQVGDRAREIGAGLGLAIAREVVEAHGGSIEAESARGQGTTFRIRLPRAPVASVSAPSAAR